MSFSDLYLDAESLDAGPPEAEPAAVVFGVPFDSTHSYRPGTRFGPDAIRQAFKNIEIFSPQYSADLESVRIKDLGNIRHTVDAARMIEMTRRVSVELAKEGRQVFVLGGEHLLSLGAYQGFGQNVGFVVFDAHYDLRDSYGDARLSHATYLRRLAELRGPDSIVHVGARAFAGEEQAFLREKGIRNITGRQIRDGMGPGLLGDVASSFDRIYVSFDLDVLDPAFAPGVGNPEALGITTRELFDLMHSLRYRKAVCVDIVELNPMVDNGVSASVAAKIMSTMMAMNL